MTNRPLINPVFKPAKPLAEKIAENKARAKASVGDYREAVDRTANLSFTVPPEPEIEPTEYDVVNKPKHYMLLEDKGVEVIHVIEAAIKANGIPAAVAPAYANVLKYMLRAGQKGSYLQDLKKAQFYLNRMVEAQDLMNWNEDK